MNRAADKHHRRGEGRAEQAPKHRANITESARMVLDCCRPALPRLKAKLAAQHSRDAPCTYIGIPHRSVAGSSRPHGPRPRKILNQAKIASRRTARAAEGGALSRWLERPAGACITLKQ